MHCLCAFNTLRSFIRGVAQFDIPIKSRALIASNKSRRQSLLHRGSSQHCQLRYSTSTSNSTAFARWDQQSARDKAAPTPDVDLRSVFAEITPEAIDALARESEPENQQQPTFSSKENIEKSRPNFRTFRASTAGNSSYGTERSPNTRERAGSAQIRLRKQQSNAQLLPPGTNHGSTPPHIDDSLPAYRQYPDEIKEQQNMQISPDGSERLAGTQQWQAPPREPWQAQKSALQEKFQEGWNPMKRLSPDALAGIRALHAQMPDFYTTATLAETFKVSPEAIRRILKSKWTPKEEEEIDRQKRWFKRGEKVWTRWSEEGMKAPAKWRAQGIGKGYYQKKKDAAEAREKKAAAGTREHVRRPSYPSIDRRDRGRPTDDIPWGS
ncbi:mitochondrion organization and biogenesis protein [Phlyctema vagabunda]|uniref:Required for respiratory growth protein 9, mitochondrial n=1 Tax=Phlyctema vagabunda TaxID=108571 RepID=A0ABR4PKV5_9HELO